MLLAVTTFSIRPGNTPAVRAILGAALQTPPLRSGAPLILSTEIGEVNTLTCLFACTDATADLQTVRGWADDIRTGEAGPRLRSLTIELFSSDVAPDRLHALAAPDVAAVLLQEFTASSAMVAAAASVRLTPLTGTQGLEWRLTPVGDPDEAVQLSMQTMADPAVRLLRSRMLLPVR